MIQQAIPDEILEECNKCKGLGIVSLDNDRHIKTSCPRCWGNGKTDWVSNITGSNDDRFWGTSGYGGYSGVSGFYGVSGVPGNSAGNSGGIIGMSGISSYSGYSVGHSYGPSPPTTQPNSSLPIPTTKPIKNSKPLLHKLIEFVNNTLG